MAPTDMRADRLGPARWWPSRLGFALTTLLALSAACPPPAAANEASPIGDLICSLAGADKPEGISLLYALGPWLAPGHDAAAADTAPLTAVGDLHGEIGNGGFSQYFFNSSGDSWKQALAGLALLGDGEGQAALNAAVRVFGAAGPALDRGQRQAQIEALPRPGARAWEELDARWLRHGKDLAAAVVRFLRARPPLAFLPPPAKPRTFMLECMMGQAVGEDWGKPVIVALRRHPASRETGSFSSAFAKDSLGTDCLIAPRDQLRVYALNAADPDLDALLGALRPAHAAIPLLCVVVGAPPAGRAPAPEPWCLYLPDLDGPALESLQRALQERLAGPPP